MSNIAKIALQYGFFPRHFSEISEQLLFRAAEVVASDDWFIKCTSWLLHTDFL